MVSLSRRESALSEENDADGETFRTTNELSGNAATVVQASSIAGGVHLYSAQPSPFTPPHELPPDVHAFADRVDQLAEMDLLLASAESTPSTSAVLVSAVSGTAGVGKTAFATHWAHRVSNRFPDGQLYVNLHGYGPGKPVAPAEALTNLLRSLNVPASDIPLDLDARSARFRSLTAGRQMLIVLDNARSAEQVRPLLPGTSSCLVLVTSRDTLPGLVSRDGARRVNLDLLPEAQALALLRMLLGEKVDEDIPAAVDLIRHCARLPLALRIAADLALSNADAPLSELVIDLADEQNRLDLLDAGADPYTAVRSVLSWSYGCLDPAEARMLRLLGLHPGREFDPTNVAVLMGTTSAKARRLLDSLVRAHLVERTRTKRYQMHDLLRVYAADLASQDEPQEFQEAALRRLFDFFLHAALLAMDLLFPQEKARRPAIPVGAPKPIHFTGEDQALRWLESERATLLSMAARTAETTWAAYTTMLSTALYRFLDVYGHFEDAVALHTFAIAAGNQIGDPGAQGRALHNLGSVYQRLGRYEEAGDHFWQAIVLARRSGVHDVAAFALSDLGLVQLLTGRSDLSLENLEEALGLFQRAGDLTGQGQVLNNMGMAYSRLDRLPEAIEHIQKALVLFRNTHDRPRQGYALNDIGVIMQATNRHFEAHDHHTEALAIARETGDRALEAAALNGLGNTERHLGSAQTVQNYHERALDISRETGDRYEEAQALEGLANMYQSSALFAPACAHWELALTIYSELGCPEAERASRNLAQLRNELDV